MVISKSKGERVRTKGNVMEALEVIIARKWEWTLLLSFLTFHSMWHLNYFRRKCLLQLFFLFNPFFLLKLTDVFGSSQILIYHSNFFAFLYDLHMSFHEFMSKLKCFSKDSYRKYACLLTFRFPSCLMPYICIREVSTFFTVIFIYGK